MTMKARFLNKVDDSDVVGCWLWTAYKDKRGYGQFRWDSGSMILAHRAVLKIYGHYLPDELCVCHKCDNPSCVRPDHLFVGTRDDNMKDMAIKDRRKWTVCKRGHPLEDGNIIINSSHGRRKCLTCHRKRDREYKQRQRIASARIQ